MCLIFAQVLTETLLILSRMQRGTVINVHWSSCKVPILMELEFHPLIFEKFSVVKFNENPSNGTEFFCDHVLTYMTKLIVAFRNFTNVLKDEIH